MTRASVYVRISSDRENLQLGVARQEKDCRRVCEDHGWHDVELYADNSISAADPTKVRPEHERLMADIIRGQVDVVVVAVSDRLYRQPAELEQFIATSVAAGMHQVVTARGEYDLTDTNDKMRLRMETVFAAYEVDKMRDRGRREREQRAQRGRPNGGGRSFGYLGVDKATGRLTGMEVNEPEAELIREAATRLLDGASLCSIRDDWTERQIPTVTGAAWSLKTLTKILTSPRIAGLRQHQGEVIGEAAWPAIIDRATWTALCALLTSRRRPPIHNAYPLRGVLRCASCGSNLVAAPRRGRRHYACRKDSGGCGTVIVSADAVERYLEARLLPIADSPELATLVATEEGHDRAERDEILKAIAVDEAKLAELSDMLADGDIDRAAYVRQTRRVSERLSAAQARLASLRGSTVLGRLGGSVQATWSELSAEDKRTIMLSLCRYVKVRQATRDANGIYHGGKVFDPSRVSIVGSMAAMANLFDGIVLDDDNDTRPESDRHLYATSEQAIEAGMAG